MVLWTPLYCWGHFEWPCLKEDHPTVNPPCAHVSHPPHMCACLSLSLSLIYHLTVTQTSKNGAQVQESQLPSERWGGRSRAD